MRAFIRIILWSVAVQLLFFLTTSRGCVVPSNLFLFGTAPCIGVAIASWGYHPPERIASLMIFSYVIALAARIGWTLTPWWNEYPGVALAIVVVPLLMAIAGSLPKYPPLKFWGKRS